MSDLNSTDLRFWDALEGGEGERGEPDLRMGLQVRLPGHGMNWVSQAQPYGAVRSDLATVSGPANLAQAMLQRLFTRVGELAALGHPEYGSRLHLLVGERNTPGNRRLLKLFILEALSREPRIRPDRIDVAVEADPHERTAVVATVAVEPVDRTGPLEFRFPFPF